MKRLLELLARSIHDWHRFVTHDVWHIGAPGERIPSGFTTKHVRVAILLLRGVYEETLLLRASALTFATMLFIVPFLAFMFMFIQSFNLGDEIYSSISHKLDAQLERVAEVINRFNGDDETEVVPEEVTPDVLPAGEPGLPEPVYMTDADGNRVPDPTAPSRATMGMDDVADVLEETAIEDDPSIEDMDNDALVAKAAELAEGRQRVNRQMWRDLIELLFPLPQDERNELDGSNPVDIMVRVAERGAANRQTITIAGIFYILTTVLGMMRNVEWTFNRIWGVNQSRNFLRTLSDYIVITLLLPFIAAGVLGVTAALQSQPVLESLGPLKHVLIAGQIVVISMTFSFLYFIVPNTRVEKRYALLGGLVAGTLWWLVSLAYVRLQIGLVNYQIFFSTIALFPLLLMWVYVSWIVLLFGCLVTFAYQNEKTFALERLSEGASFAYREAVAVRAIVEMTRRFRKGLSAFTVAEAAEAWNVPTRLLNETMDTLVEAKLATPVATLPISYQPARAPETVQVIDVVRAMREAGRDPSLLRKDEAYRPLYQGLNEVNSAYLTSTMGDLARDMDHAAENPPPPKIVPITSHKE